MKCITCGKDSKDGYLVQIIFGDVYCVDCAFNVSNEEAQNVQEKQEK